MRVLFLTNLPSPYRVEFFNKLGELCDLTVVYQTDISKERNALWKANVAQYTYKSVFLKTLIKFNDSAICTGVTRYLNPKKFDIIVVTGNSTLFDMQVIFFLKARKIPYIFESDGGIPKDGKGAKEWLKKVVTSGAKLYLSSGKMNDRYFAMYGAPESAIRHYPFTSIYNKDVLPDIPTEEEKAALRQKLGVTEEKMILSVGRFSYLGGYGKGYDVVLRSARELPENVGIYIVGDEPTAVFVEMKEKQKLDHVHFVGYKTKTDLQEYYKAADLFVLMTVSDVWGLVLNEAMSNGLPVITTGMCGAAPDLVIPGENGYILPVGDDAGLKMYAEEILGDSARCREMGRKSLAVIREYTYEKMVEKHMAVFEEMVGGRKENRPEVL